MTGNGQQQAALVNVPGEGIGQFVLAPARKPDCLKQVKYFWREEIGASIDHAALWML